MWRYSRRIMYSVVVVEGELRQASLEKTDYISALTCEGSIRSSTFRISFVVCSASVRVRIYLKLVTIFFQCGV